MSNLTSAKASIEAEIIQSKKEISTLHARIESLEETLSHIAALSGIADAKSVKATSAGKRKAKADIVKPAKAAKATKAAMGGKQAKEAKGENDLPSTGGEYWPDLVTGQPQSASDILHAAIGKLGFTPTKDQVQKLTQRATFALNSLVKIGKIQDSGSGRERRFFKA